MSLDLSAYRFVDRGLIIPSEDLLVVCDLHFEQSNRVSGKRVLARLRELISEYSIETVVFNGDVFSEFPFIESGVDVLRQIDKMVSEVVLLEGNHERLVGGFGKLATEFRTACSYSVEIDDCRVCITHGDTVVDSECVDVFVIGHIHPGDSLSRPYAAVLSNAYDRCDVLVLPAFTDVGVQEVCNAGSASPFIPRDVSKSEYSVVEQFD